MHIFFSFLAHYSPSPYPSLYTTEAQVYSSSTTFILPAGFLFPKHSNRWPGAIYIWSLKNINRLSTMHWLSKWYFVAFNDICPTYELKTHLRKNKFSKLPGPSVLTKGGPNSSRLKIEKKIVQLIMCIMAFNLQD